MMCVLWGGRVPHQLTSTATAQYVNTPLLNIILQQSSLDTSFVYIQPVYVPISFGISFIIKGILSGDTTEALQQSSEED